MTYAGTTQNCKKPNALPITKGIKNQHSWDRDILFLFFFFQLTSQHPYAEVFIGRPHVWTVDLDNQEEVEDAVKAILSQKVVSSIPFSPLVTWAGFVDSITAPLFKESGHFYVRSTLELETSRAVGLAWGFRRCPVKWKPRCCPDVCVDSPSPLDVTPGS